MTTADREELERRLAINARSAADLFDRHSAAQMTSRPAEASWSAAECIVHLSLTAASMVPLLETAIQELRSQGFRSSSPSRMDLMGRLLKWMLEPPPRLKTKTTAPFEPQQVEPLAEVIPALMKQHARLNDLLRAAEGFDWSRAKVTSPFNSRVRYNVFSTFQILETHERRHLWQAEEALSSARQAGC